MNKHGFCQFTCDFHNLCSMRDSTQFEQVIQHRLHQLLPPQRNDAVELTSRGHNYTLSVSLCQLFKHSFSRRRLYEYVYLFYIRYIIVCISHL